MTTCMKLKWLGSVDNIYRWECDRQSDNQTDRQNDKPTPRKACTSKKALFVSNATLMPHKLL